MVTVSPAAASATTADAFCFNARIPTSDMCFVVTHWLRRARAQAVAVENMDVVAGAHEVSTVMPLAHLPFAVLTAGEQQRPPRLPEVLA